MGKRKRQHAVDSEKTDDIPDSSYNEEQLTKKGKWTNKQRVLIFASRGINFRHRHLMLNLRTLFPHSKPESKMEKKGSLLLINEICEMKNCNHCVYFETRKHKDLYMWISSTPNGPSAKFLVENIHTMEELKLTGNCLKGSRPVLSFDKAFDESPHFSLLKEVFIKVFGTPNHHPKSMPFVDHVFNFAILDNRIWFRNYQIEDDGNLIEIGPRFVLNLIKIFDGSFGGRVLFTNPQYITPGMHRRNLKIEAANRYKLKKESKRLLEIRRPESSYKLDTLDEVFETVSKEESNKNE